MAIFKNSRELYSNFLYRVNSDIPSRVFIMTYGLWCGVNAKGVGVAPKCTTYRLLSYLNLMHEYCKTTIIVGYDNVLPMVVIETARRFRNIEFVAVNKLHSKCILASDGYVCVGSSNLTDSTWSELNIDGVVNVDSPEYSEIHKDISGICENRGEVIVPEKCDTVNISELIRRSP